MLNIIIENLNAEISKYLDKYNIILFLNSIIRTNKKYMRVSYLYYNKYIRWDISNIIIKELKLIYNQYIYIKLTHFIIPSNYLYNDYNINNLSYIINSFEKYILNNNHIIVINKFNKITDIYLGCNNNPYYDYYYSYILKLYNFNYIYDFLKQYQYKLSSDLITITYYLYEDNIYEILSKGNNYIKYKINKEKILNTNTFDINYKIFYSFINK